MTRPPEIEAKEAKTETQESLVGLLRSNRPAAQPVWAILAPRHGGAKICARERLNRCFGAV